MVMMQRGNSDFMGCCFLFFCEEKEESLEGVNDERNDDDADGKQQTKDFADAGF